MNFLQKWALYKPKETEEQLIERWADILITHSNYKGEVDRKSFTLDYVFEDLPAVEEQDKWLNHPARKIRDEVMKELTVEKDGYKVITHTLIRHLDLVKYFLLKNGYILEPNVRENFWRLSEKGFWQES